MLEINKTYNEDCLDTMANMPDNAVDIIVTSPPYNLNKNASGGGTSKMNYDNWYADDMPEEEYQDWQKKVIRECIRVTRGSIFYNHRIRYAWHGRNKYRTQSKIYHPMDWLREFPIWCEMIWDRGGTSGHVNKRCKLSDERIYQIGKPVVFNDMGYTTIWKINPSKNIGHVCSFPEELVERCIRMCTNVGDLVYDPFMGSGTVAVVANRLDRNYIGSEISKEYCELYSVGPSPY